MTTDQVWVFNVTIGRTDIDADTKGTSRAPTVEEVVIHKGAAMALQLRIVDAEHHVHDLKEISLPQPPGAA
jgi:hypothetical protein